MIARNFDTSVDKNISGGVERKRRVKAFLSDKELQVAIYLAMTKLKRKTHPSRPMSMQNLTLSNGGFGDKNPGSEVVNLSIVYTAF